MCRTRSRPDSPTGRGRNSHEHENDMEAALKTYGKRRIINIYYSTSVDGHDWTDMVERAKRLCNVGDEHCAVIFTPHTAREVMYAGR
jgi:hypothetical protein